ncbi:MAG: PQQ-binding-like beta-propeller repeat protein, partial [bacterium]
MAVLLSCASVWASDYLTEGVDNGRTGWMKDEKVFTTANVAGMKLLWKIKLESTPREMHNLFPPLVAERVTTAQGAREMAVVAGVSDDLFGIDVASGELMWKKHFDSTYTPPAGGRGGGTLCPGGQTANPVMAQASPGKYTIYAVSWDGRFRQINLADGQDVAPPEKFVPSNGKPYALNLFNNAIHTATAQGCGGVPNAFYSYDLASKKSSIFQPAGGGLWGRRGAAIAPDGTTYLGTGDG